MACKHRARRAGPTDGLNSTHAAAFSFRDCFATYREPHNRLTVQLADLLDPHASDARLSGSPQFSASAGGRVRQSHHYRRAQAPAACAAMGVRLMGNVFDQFDPPAPAKKTNVFDQFDVPQPRQPQSGMFDDLIPAQPPQAAAETLSAEDFAKKYGQPQQESLSPAEFAQRYGAPAPQQSAGMFDDLIPQATAAPDPAAAIAAHRAPIIVGHGGAMASPRQQADAIVSGRDLGREVAQDATFNYSDEAIAGVRAALGEDYAKALQNERDELKAAQDRLGTGGRVAAEGLSMLFPMGPVAKAVQRIAGPGAGLLKTAGASGIVMAPVGGVSAVGALDDKSDVGADVQAALTGAGEAALTAGALHTVGVPAYRLGKKVVQVASDLGSRPAEWFRYRNENPVPLSSTTNYAVKKLADSAAQGGMRTPQDVQAAIDAFAVPDTPSALVNTGNDRLAAEATQVAADLRRPNVPRIVNGQRESGNVFDALRDAQATNATGQTQGDAFRDRLFTSSDVPAWDRDLPNVMQQNRAELANRSLALQDLERQPYSNVGRMPGFLQALESPDFARAYRDAADAIAIPGSPDSIARDALPLLPDDYAAAVQAHANGTRATAPVALTDDNIPMPVLSLMRRNISAGTQNSKNPVAQESARRMLALYDHLSGGGASNGPVRDLNRINRQMHELHNDSSDIAAGYQIPTQSGPTRADTIADARMLPGDRQDNIALGMVHGVADASKAQNDNLGGLTEGMFANPDFQQAFDHFVQARSPYARPAAEIRDELSNIGDMQGVSSLLRSTSQSRQVDVPTLPAEALRFYVAHKVAPSLSLARTARELAHGGTQARTAETARLLTDTSGEGVRRLTEELARRNAAAHAASSNPPPFLRTVVLNEIARQLAGGNQQNSQ